MTSDDPVSVGLAAVELVRSGRFAELCDMFAPSLRPLLTAEGLSAAWSGEVEQLGDVVSVGEPVSSVAGAGSVVVRIPVTFSHGSLTVVVSIASGWLAGLQLAPASAAEPVRPWQPPSYVDVDGFDEREVTIGSGPLAVPGTVTVPRRSGPFPGVALLTGSGPQDRDETIGRNKPFKDLAWGLASRGVAVVRFDKVTYAHRDVVLKDRGFTMAAEYLPDAVAAIALLGGVAGVDRVFVLGHSLGGTVAPRVAAASPGVAGLVLLAGGAQPMHWAAVRQFRYLASLGEGMADAAVSRLSAQARLVDSSELSPATPDSALPFGTPAAYWLDLRSYDPVATAARLGLPVFVLQGGRDYQATVEDDLAGWRAGLGDLSGLTVRVYEADNHFFFPGSGPSTPAEYEPVQHMDEAVVTDIASWLVAGTL